MFKWGILQMPHWSISVLALDSILWTQINDNFMGLRNEHCNVKHFIDQLLHGSNTSKLKSPYKAKLYTVHTVICAGESVGTLDSGAPGRSTLDWATLQYGYIPPVQKGLQC